MPSSPRSLALAGIVLATVVGLVALATALLPGAAPLGAAIALAWATALLLASLIVLGGAGPRGWGGAGIAAATVLLVVGGGVAAAFLVGGAPDPAAPRVWGLPRGAAILLYGVGLAPALVVPLIYAWTFDRTTLSARDLEGLRDRDDRDPLDGSAPDRDRAPRGGDPKE